MRLSRIRTVLLASCLLLAMGCDQSELCAILSPDLQTSFCGGASPLPDPDNEPPPLSPEGCIELQLFQTPNYWPFDDSAEGYLQPVWTELNEMACNVGICHGGSQIPLISPDEVSANRNYQNERAALWPYFSNAVQVGISTEKDDLVGGIWFHHPNAGNLTLYNAFSISALNRIISNVNSCVTADADAEAIARSDPECDNNPPPDDAVCYCLLGGGSPPSISFCAD